jgi:glyoxylase-like metal-dependent hydrolase (beta-lactamase superfamily II)
LTFVQRITLLLLLAGDVTAPRPMAPRAVVEPAEVAPGVFVFPSLNTTEDLVDGNSTYIIGSKAVLIVDAPSTRLTLQHLAWLRSRTNLPVRYLVTTHWHPDHTSGNHVLADSCPGLAILGSEFTKRVGDLRTPPYVAQTRAGLTDLTEALERQIAAGQDLARKELTAPELARARRAVQYLDGERPYMKDARYVGPTEIVQSERRVDLGGRVVIIRQYPGHTLGDLVAIVPSAGVVMTGDLVVNPVPYGTGQTVFRQWTQSLAELEKPPGIETIVPGHGAVLRSWDYVRIEREAIDTLVAQVTVAARDGLTLDQARARVDLSRFRAAFAGADPDKQWAFDNYFLGTGIKRAFDEANGFVD